MIQALLALLLLQQQHVSFPTEDGQMISANLYGSGDRGVVLAHGGQFRKESWEKQARLLEKAGFRVLAFDFRGFGQSPGPRQPDAPVHLDVLAAVRYLRKAGATRVAVVGASFGGGAAADAVITARPGEIDRLVELGNSAGNFPPEKITVPKLIIVARGDTDGHELRLPGIQKDYARMPEPKRLLILEGSAHAQFLFLTDQSGRVMQEILRFLLPR
jgi:pimeloyl-ACP methyl ester carboxylesterase